MKDGIPNTKYNAGINKKEVKRLSIDIDVICVPIIILISVRSFRQILATERWIHGSIRVIKMELP